LGSWISGGGEGVPKSGRIRIGKRRDGEECEEESAARGARSEDEVEARKTRGVSNMGSGRGERKSTGRGRKWKDWGNENDGGVGSNNGREGGRVGGEPEGPQ